MEDNNLRLEYYLDFSQNGYFNEEKDKDNNLDDLIREAIKSSENRNYNIQIDFKKIKNFLYIKQRLIYIAKENSTLMKIKMPSSSPTIIIELESETLDFDTDELKNMFIDILKTSKFVCFEARKNGKIGLTVEIDVRKN